MKGLQLVLGFFVVLATNSAMAETATPPMEVPIISGSLLAITLICLATVYYCARNKRKQ